MIILMWTRVGVTSLQGATRGIGTGLQTVQLTSGIRMPSQVGSEHGRWVFIDGLHQADSQRAQRKTAI